MKKTVYADAALAGAAAWNASAQTFQERGPAHLDEPGPRRYRW